MNTQKPVRVAHLIGSTGLYGAERWILAQMRYLDRSRIEASVINLVDSPGEQSAIVSEAQRLGYHAQDLYTGGRFNPAAAVRVARQLRADGIAVVHSHGFKSDVMGLLAGRLADAKVISTPHGWSLERNRKLALYEEMSKLSFRFLDCICPLSQNLYDGLADHGFKERRLRLIMNGVDTQEIDAVAAKPKSTDKKRVGYIGQFIARKNLEQLIEAFTILKRNNCELYLIGDGPLRQTYSVI